MFDKTGKPGTLFPSKQDAERHQNGCRNGKQAGKDKAEKRGLHEQGWDDHDSCHNSDVEETRNDHASQIFAE